MNWEESETKMWYQTLAEQYKFCSACPIKVH